MVKLKNLFHRRRRRNMTTNHSTSNEITTEAQLEVEEKARVEVENKAENRNKDEISIENVESDSDDGDPFPEVIPATDREQTTEIVSTVSRNIEYAKNVFSKMDLNTDGELSIDEFKSILPSLHQGIGKRKSAVPTLDENSTSMGEIPMDSFLMKCGGREQVQTEKKDEVLGSSRLILDENMTHAQLLDSFLMKFGGSEQIVTIDDLFNAMDSNKDGTIELFEFISYIAKMETCIGIEETFKQIKFLDDAVEKYLSSEEGVAKRIFSKGISLGQLLHFLQTYCFDKKMFTEKATTYEVVSQVIIPESASNKSCMADILPGGPKNPVTLMSHWWGNRFFELVRSCCEHAAGKSELYSHMYTEEEKSKTFWICIFAVNQHVSICDTMSKPCNCGAVQYKPGHPLCEMDKFPLVVKRIRKHGLAMDSNLTTLKRVWVLSELDAAMNSDPPMRTKFCGSVSRKMLEDPHIPSVQEAECKFVEDKNRILGGIESRDGGYAKFNGEIKKLALFEISRIHLFRLISFGEQDKKEMVVSLLKRFPSLINSRNTKGRGETPIMLAARYGHSPLVKLFLEYGADVHAVTKNFKWTVLHYAAVCFNPENQSEIMEILLERGNHPEKIICDPNLCNSFNRTALDECILNVGKNADASELLQKATSVNGFNFEACNDFMPQPRDAYIFSHWMLRQDSWYRPDLEIAIKQPVDGEIITYNSWVKPINFGTPAGQPVPLCMEAIHLITAAHRYAAYVKYRWPLWKFDSILFKYTTVDAPQHYRVNLSKHELSQAEDKVDESNMTKQIIYLRGHDVLTRVTASVRFLYP